MLFKLCHFFVGIKKLRVWHERYSWLNKFEKNQWHWVSKTPPQKNQIENWSLLSFIFYFLCCFWLLNIFHAFDFRLFLWHFNFHSASQFLSAGGGKRVSLIHFLFRNTLPANVTEVLQHFRSILFQNEAFSQRPLKRTLPVRSRLIRLQQLTDKKKKKKNAIDVKVFNPYSTLTGNVNSNGYAAVKEFLRGSFFPGYLVSSFRNCVTPRRFVVLCNSTKDKHVVGSSWFILRVLKLVVILLLKFRFMSPNVCCWHARWNNISSSTLRTWKARGIYMDL